jgi:hypothetical protein
MKEKGTSVPERLTGNQLPANRKLRNSANRKKRSSNTFIPNPFIIARVTAQGASNDLFRVPMVKAPLDPLHTTFEPVDASAKLGEVAVHIGEARLYPAQHSVLGSGAVF